MSLAGFLEGVVGGDKQISKDMKALGTQGQASYGYGTGLVGEGVDATRRLGDAYQQMLNSGASVLPDSTNSVLARARGRVQDQNVRDIAATGARLRQARIAGGGSLSPEAAQEYLTQAEADSNRQSGDSTLALDTQQAGMELTETNNLRDRLAAARAQILSAGQFQQQLGQQEQISALQLRHNRLAAIASTIASTAGGAKGGFT